MQLQPQVIGYYCVIVGVSMIAGWWTAFRNRLYLGLLGVFFLALAAFLMISGKLQEGPKTALLVWGGRAAVGVAVVAFVAATVAAVRESQQRLRDVREHYHAASEALLEMAKVKQELQRREAEQAQRESAADDDTVGHDERDKS